MAYKFQLGNAVLSGSLTQKEGLNAGDDGLSNAGAIAGATTIAASGLASIGSLAVDDTSTIGCDSDTDIITLDSQEVSFANDVNVIVGKAGGLNLADGAVTSTAAELNFNDGATSGSAVAGKTLVVDGDRDIANLRNVSATQLSASANVLVGGDITGSGGITVADTSGLLRGNGGLVDTGNGIQLNSTVAGDGLAHAAGVLSVNVGQGLQITGDAVQIQDGQVDNDMLAGSITASKLNGAIFADLETLGAASSDGEFIVATGAGAFAYESGNTARTSLGLGTGNDVTFTTGSFTGDLTVSGDLTVQGDVVAIEATTLRVVDKLIEIASGSANDAALDGGGIQFNSGDSNKTLTFQATGDNLASSEHFSLASGKLYKIANTEVLSADGAKKVQSDVAGAGLAHSDGVLSLANATNGGLTINANDMQLNLNDLAAATVAVANDSIAFIDADDNSTKKESVSDFIDLIAGGGLTATNGVLSTSTNAVALIDNLGTGSTGVNYWAALAGNETMVLPNAPTVGDSVRIKAPSNCGEAGTITISPLNGSHSIDGSPSIVLESPHAAVELVYVVNNLWKVF